MVLHQCHLCDYNTKQKSHLKTHLADIHNIDVIWFPCHLCDFKTKQKSILKTHLADIHNICWRPFWKQCRNHYGRSGNSR